MAGLLVLLGAAFPATGVAFATQFAHTGKAAAAQTFDARDRQFLTVIRFANLWEIPMADLATKRGTTDEVKTAGTIMRADHKKLNIIVKDLADKFGVQLPDKPKSTQQAWMAEISGKTGEDFDRTWATRLRAAHGTVFNLIAEVRAGTRNDTILDFATQANGIVLKHMQLLEATGYVNPQTGHFAQASARTTSYPENTLSAGDLALGATAFLVVAVGTILGVRLLSARDKTT